MDRLCCLTHLRSEHAYIYMCVQATGMCCIWVAGTGWLLVGRMHRLKQAGCIGWQGARNRLVAYGRQAGRMHAHPLSASHIASTHKAGEGTTSPYADPSGTMWRQILVHHDCSNGGLGGLGCWE